MSATILNKKSNKVIGARLIVPASAWDLYEAVLDVRNFPRWAPGVRRVEVLEGAGEPGMVSEWEVSILGIKKKISSVLEEAEAPALLCWSYDGLVRGWGQCVIEDWGDGALAEFRTELHPTEPILEKLMWMPTMQCAISSHVRRSLARLGQVVSGSGVRVQVDPPEELS
jgi:hypothetical protein